MRTTLALSLLGGALTATMMPAPASAVCLYLTEDGTCYDTCIRLNIPGREDYCLD